jgi:foldase protein PrsA
MRLAKLIVLWAAVCVSGCDMGWPGREPGPAPTPPAAAETSEAPPADAGVMAYVNGEPVPMSLLHEMLVKGPGPKFARELVRHEMVRQAAERKGVSVSDADLKAEHEWFLEVAFPSIPEPDQRERALGQLLAGREVSREQWDMSIRTAALLRKLAEPLIEVTDEEVREEFGRQYGRQVVVRHIQLANLREAQRVKDMTEQVGFEQLAKTYSLHPTGKEGGLLDPIGASTKLPPAMEGIRQVALSLKTVGEISDPVQVGTTFHLLKLEQVIEPKEAKFENVADELRETLRQRKIRLAQKEILERLIREAKVEYVHPDLRAAEETPPPGQGALP